MHTEYPNGLIICGDCCDPGVIEQVTDWVNANGTCSLVIADPPYGNILGHEWDKQWETDQQMADWLRSWTIAHADAWLPAGGAMYVFGGTGKVNFRPFYKYLSTIEASGLLQLANHITWAKKRAYGLKHNYLYTREEIAYFIKGDHKKPRCFNIPYLDIKRGYAGYNPKYPAKSEFYRRTNVWSDIIELLRNKDHVAQKPLTLFDVMIDVHTEPGEIVIDPFAGSGAVGTAALQKGRKFVLIDQDPDCYNYMCDHHRR
jgi:DNA modification methylase